MALPENRSTNAGRTHVDDLGDERAVEQASRGGWRWWWIWPVIIALAFWWAGWGWGGTGGWWFGRTQASHNTAIAPPPGARTTETIANAGAKQPLTSAGADAGGARVQNQIVGPGVQILNAENKRSYIGKEFVASDVPVEQKVSDRVVWLGSSNAMLAVLPSGNKNSADNAGEADDARPGTIVDAKGTVKKAPSAAQAKREWALSDQDASKLEQEGAYIQVSQLTVPQQQ